MYENVANNGDAAALANLRASIEGRIEDLEAFYLRNVDDERSVLFEKQRLKLRKLLHEYDTYAATLTTGNTDSNSSAPNPGPMSPNASSVSRTEPAASQQTGPAGASNTGHSTSGGVTTRVIREDTRLNLSELSAWFEQAGADEMP